jgi:hypothetical protein
VGRLKSQWLGIVLVLSVEMHVVWIQGRRTVGQRRDRHEGLESLHVQATALDTYWVGWRDELRT